MSGYFHDLIKRLEVYFKVNENSDDKIKHSMRVIEDLRDVGFSASQLRHLESRRMPEIVRPDERIKAAIHGTAEIKGHAIMVATDKRIIYFDHTPFLDALDEFNYVVVSGASYSTNGFSWSITVHTKIGDRTLTGVKNSQARRFIDYVELRCIDYPV